MEDLNNRDGKSDQKGTRSLFWNLGENKILRLGL